jgi:hypothetical protein
MPLSTTTLTNYSSLTTPFLLHALIELPAALQFLLLPSRQLGRPTPHAHALMRQYALLLISSVIIALAFAFAPVGAGAGAGSSGKGLAEEDEWLRAKVAAALALYHVGPVVRSIGRLRGRWERGEGVVWCEPGLYLVVHVVVGEELGRCAWLCW